MNQYNESEVDHSNQSIHLANSGLSVEEIPSVTIVIPCHSAEYGLEHCLQATCAQDYCGEIQIIVANDGNCPEVHEICRRFAITEIVVKTSGSSYRARNEAIRNAKSSFIAFTDANKFPRRDWVSRGIGELLSRQASYLAGAVQVIPHPRRGKDMAYWYEYYRAFPIHRYVSENHFGVTGNLFVRKNLFETLGAFDGNLISGGDYELGKRVFAAGHEIAFDHTVSVTYYARSLRSILEKAIRVQKGLLDLAQKTGKRIKVAIPFRKLLRTLIPSRQLCINPLKSGERTLLSDAKVLIVVILVALVTTGFLMKHRLTGRYPEGYYY